MTTADDAGTVQIDVWADVVCPACYLADNRLHTAIERSGKADRIELVLHAFELHPDTPDEVQDNSEVLAKMMGAPVAQVEAGEARFQAIAHADGLPFAISRKHRNTRSIHRVLKVAEESGQAGALMTALQRAAFSGDEHAFDHEFLVSTAVALGIDEQRVRETLDGDAFTDEVADDRAQAIALGARGVPFAVFDGRFAVPGAATVDGYLAAIERAFAQVDA